MKTIDAEIYECIGDLAPIFFVRAKSACTPFGDGVKLYHFVSLVIPSGNIAKWNKKEGDEIAAGDSIAEIETDKATMDWEAQDDGFVAKILAEEGAKDVSVGSPVIVIVEEEVNCCLINARPLLFTGSVFGTIIVAHTLSHSFGASGRRL